MDVLGLVSLSSASLTVLMAFGALGAALITFIAGAALALRANRAAEESRASLELAETKFKQAASMADDVRALRAQVEDLSARYQDIVAQSRFAASEPTIARNTAPAEQERVSERHDFDARDETRGGEGSDFRRSAFSSERLLDDDDDRPRGILGWMRRR